ncbi:hypothetical protein MIDIC_590009 [Alphaproteobacteria bacterium]
MLVHFIKKLFESDSERFIKKLKLTVGQIDDSEPESCSATT